MTLNQLSQQSVLQIGNTVGFEVKSVVSGNVFKVVAKTENGKFVISRPGKDSIVLGDQDRYELVVGRASEITVRLAELDIKREAMIQEIDVLESEEIALRNELLNLGN